jgi:hypothetical protein
MKWKKFIPVQKVRFYEEKSNSGGGREDSRQLAVGRDEHAFREL